MPLELTAATISGTVKDASGAMIPQARIEISGGEFVSPLIVSSDAQGHFTSPDLEPGAYSIRVTREGFEPSDWSGRKRENKVAHKHYAERSRQ